MTTQTDNLYTVFIPTPNGVPATTKLNYISKVLRTEKSFIDMVIQEGFELCFIQKEWDWIVDTKNCRFVFREYKGGIEAFFYKSKTDIHYTKGIFIPDVSSNLKGVLCVLNFIKTFNK